jgi:hypothetical protein
MKKHVLILLVATIFGATTGGAEAQTSEARKEPAFHPRATSIPGTDRALSRAPFVRVWTQGAGELAVAKVGARYVNLALDFPFMLRKLQQEDEPLVAYTTVAWADQLLRIECRIDKSRSSVLRLRFRIVLRVVEGSIGSVLPGTDFAETEFRIFLENGQLVMTSDFEFMPGILPDVLPTDWVMSEIIIPDSWLVFRPGEVIAEHTFISVVPAGGHEPRVHTVVETFPIGKRERSTRR